MKPSLSRFSAVFVLALAAAACEQTTTAPVVPPSLEPVAATVRHVCSPQVLGPGTMVQDSSATFGFSYAETCNLASIHWTVTYDATITGTVPVWLAPVGTKSGGAATVKAGECNFSVSAHANFGSGTVVVTKPVSLNYNCHKPYFAAYVNSHWLGLKVEWNDVGASQYRVYRRVIRASDNQDLGETLLGTTTGLQMVDQAYQTWDRFTFHYTNWYRVVAVRNNAVDLEDLAGTYARSTQAVICCREPAVE